MASDFILTNANGNKVTLSNPDTNTSDVVLDTSDVAKDSDLTTLSNTVDNIPTVDSKALATAWVNFDGTTTPPTIRDSFNVSDVVRTATGRYEIYFTEDMDNANFSVSLSGYGGSDANRCTGIYGSHTVSKCTVYGIYQNADSSFQNMAIMNLNIFGGKN